MTIKGQIKLEVTDEEVRYIITFKKRGRKPGSGAPRKSWDDYGISKERYRELKEYCESKENAAVVLETALETSGMIADHIFASVTKNKSFEGVEYLSGELIPCGRTDFYGYRRLFYHLLDERLKNESDHNG